MPVFALVTKAIFPSSFMLLGSKLERAAAVQCAFGALASMLNFMPGSAGHRRDIGNRRLGTCFNLGE